MFSNDKTSDWFDKFTDQYKTDGKLPRMMELKKRHSRRVCEIACAIRESMEWDEFGDGWLAYSIGLLHDVGRFPQYQKYGTFLDAASIDHGDAAEAILSEQFDWDCVPELLRKDVLAAVKYHNKLEIPTSLPVVTYRWCALARDADKIDIFHMVQHRLENGTIADMLPRHAQYEGLTPELVAEIRQNGKGSYKYAKSLQDFRLIQLTWGCDLNFAVSVVTLKSEQIFEKIVQDLRPWHIDDLLDTLQARIDAIG